MRETKFRAISERTNGFVYGSLFNADTGMTIIENGGGDMSDFHFVKPETVGQLTGLKDKNGVEIYEGDIVKNSLIFFKGEIIDKNNPVYKNYVVDWHDGNTLGFRIKNRRNIMPLNRNKVFNAQSEVIGNIHQNPELLT